MQDYKSLCLAVMICATLINKTHKHTHTHTQLLASYTISSASRVKISKRAKKQSSLRRGITNTSAILIYCHLTKLAGYLI